jgi:hypothetical protein
MACKCHLSVLWIFDLKGINIEFVESRPWDFSMNKLLPHLQYLEGGYSASIQDHIQQFVLPPFVFLPQGFHFSLFPPLQTALPLLILIGPLDHLNLLLNLFCIIDRLSLRVFTFGEGIGWC